jgi:multiple sugar transport system substrate-binding protein
MLAIAIAWLYANPLMASGSFRANLPTAVQQGVALAGAGAAGRPEERITAWMREVVGSREFDVLRSAAQRFNSKRPPHPVVLLPAIYLNYEERVKAAAAAGTLPCLLEVDGPFVAEFAWAGDLQALDRFIPRPLLEDLLPSILDQGRYAGHLYTLGQFESGLGLWGNKRYLRAAGIRIATVEKPWTLQEFETAMQKLSAVPGVEYALNLDLATGSSEFYSYAFAPILQGFGGDLIDRSAYASARGVLDGSESVAAMKRFQSWFQRSWAKPASRHSEFEEGKAALSWSGHWFYSIYHRALGRDLVLMPLPDLGAGTKTGMGSWTWAISSTCPYPAEAWRFLAQLMTVEEILRLTNVNAGMPARRSARARSALYGKDGPLSVFAQQLDAGHGVPRPKTPAYGIIRDSFRTATRAIVDGADVQTELSKAAVSIDREIVANRGYPDPLREP